MPSTNYVYIQKRTRHKLNSALMAEGKPKPKSSKSPTKQISDTDTSDEEQVNPVLKTSEDSTHPF